MRQLTALIVSVGVLAAPAFAQYQSQIPNLAGTWTATLQFSNGDVTTVTVDLAQSGTRLGGREKIIYPRTGIALRLTGQLTSPTTGSLIQAQIEQTNGISNFCRQGLVFRLTGPNTMALRLIPSDECDSNSEIKLTRVPTNVSRNRTPQITPGQAILGALLLGAMGGDSGASRQSGPSETEIENYKYNQREEAERQERQAQQEREREQGQQPCAFNCGQP